MHYRLTEGQITKILVGAYVRGQRDYVEKKDIGFAPTYYEKLTEELLGEFPEYRESWDEDKCPVCRGVGPCDFCGGR